MVGTNDPKIATYKMAGNYSQYGITWPITSNRVVSIAGDGNIMQLENSAISVSQH